MYSKEKQKRVAGQEQEVQLRASLRELHQKHQNQRNALTLPMVERFISNILNRILEFEPSSQNQQNQQNQEQNQRQNQPQKPAPANDAASQKQNEPESPFHRIIRYVKDLILNPKEVTNISKKFLEDMQSQSHALSSKDLGNMALLNVLANIPGGISPTVLSNLGNSIGIQDFDPRQSSSNDNAALGGVKGSLDDSLKLSDGVEQREFAMGGSVESENSEEVKRLGNQSTSPGPADCKAH